MRPFVPCVRHEVVSLIFCLVRYLSNARVCVLRSDRTLRGSGQAHPGGWLRGLQQHESNVLYTCRWYSLRLHEQKDTGKDAPQRPVEETSTDAVPFRSARRADRDDAPILEDGNSRRLYARRVRGGRNNVRRRAREGGARARGRRDSESFIVHDPIGGCRRNNEREYMQRLLFSGIYQGLVA